MWLGEAAGGGGVRGGSVRWAALAVVGVAAEDLGAAVSAAAPVGLVALWAAPVVVAEPAVRGKRWRNKVTMHDEIAEFVTRLRQAAGDNLESVLLYGSAARDEHDETYSDINLLCALRSAGDGALDAIAPVIEWWSKSKGQRPPMILTVEDLTDSADVFAIETLDIKTAHRVLHGRDILAGIDIPMNLHRIQLEHELRTLVLRLRQHYLLASADEDDLKRVLAKSVSSVTTLLRHALIATGQVVPTGNHEVVAAVERSLGTGCAAVHSVLDLREDRRVADETRALYRAYVDCLAVITRQVDRAAPKSDWQRVTDRSQ